MTEEQKKKCEEIYNLHIDFPLKIRPIFLPKFGWVKIAMLLAEVFNKNITEEEAGEIFNNIFNNIGKMNCVKAKAILLPIGINPISQSNYKDTFWKIANYFDNGNKEANKINKINNVIENTAKEKIMPNNDELTLNLLVLGKTGVGKSSLLNALVGKEVEETRSASKPVTKRGIFPHEAEIDGKKVIIHDSWGLEVGKDEEWEKIINNALKEKGIDKDIKDWFHSVTYCIQAGGYKIQDFDIEIIKQFVDEGYNVIVALTKSDQIGKAKREEFIDKIKKEVKEKTKKDIMVITVSADPEQLDHMTEKPKPSGLEEYKAAILISWREIFINRIPVHIVEKLKKDIENAKSNAPREGKDKELSNKIQEYFSNILNENTQKYVRENIEKYYKITADILASSKNINLSNKELDLNFHSEVEGATKETWEMFTEIWEYEELNFGDRIKLIGAATLMIPLAILENIAKPMEYLMHLWEKEDKIKEFIEEVSEEYTKKIGEEEFESEIRKIIINNLNEIDKKIIKLN